MENMPDYSFSYTNLDDIPMSQIGTAQNRPYLSAGPAGAQKYIFINDYISTCNNEYIQIIFVSSGSGKIVLGNTERQIKQGMVSIIDGGSVFKVFPLSPVIIYSCSFNPSLFGCKAPPVCSIDDISTDKALSFFFRNDDYDRVCSRVPKIKLDAVQRIFNDMVAETEAPSTAYQHIMRLKISELLIRLADTTFSEEDNPELRDVQLVNQIIAYIKNNYAKKLTYDDLTKMICVSRSKLFLMFKQITGKTIGKYIEDVRIERACMLLSTTNDTVFKVMLDVGYKDMKMFCKRFKEFTDMTPTNYRKQHNVSS